MGGGRWRGAGLQVERSRDFASVAREVASPVSPRAQAQARARAHQRQRQRQPQLPSSRIFTVCCPLSTPHPPIAASPPPAPAMTVADKIKDAVGLSAGEPKSALDHPSAPLAAFY